MNEEVQTQKGIEISAVVVRCRCGKKEYEPNHVCPKGKREKFLLAYYSRNPFKHWYYNILIKIQELRRG